MTSSTSNASNVKLRDLHRWRTVRYSEDAGRFCSNSAVGIELEIEGFTGSTSSLDHDLVQVIDDNSLRNYGREFIFNGPQSGVKIEQALDSLYSVVQSSNCTVSERCSTHIHIDITDLTAQQFKNFVACSVLFEHVLFGLFGSTRRSNMFCLPVDCNTYQMNLIGDILERDTAFPSGTGISKYSGLSFNRFRDLGTVEFRMFDAVLDKERACNLIEFLLRMKKYSTENLKKPEDLIDIKLSKRLRDVFIDVFKDEALVQTFEDEQNLNDLMERGIQTLNDVLVRVQVTDSVNAAKASHLKEIERLHDVVQRAEYGLVPPPSSEPQPVSPERASRPTSPPQTQFNWLQGRTVQDIENMIRETTQQEFADVSDVSGNERGINTWV